MTLDPQALDTLFREARTHNTWQDKGVDDDTIAKLIAAASLSQGHILGPGHPEHKLQAGDLANALDQLGIWVNLPMTVEQGESTTQRMTIGSKGRSLLPVCFVYLF